MSDFKMQTIDYVLKGLSRQKRPYVFLPELTNLPSVSLKDSEKLPVTPKVQQEVAAIPKPETQPEPKKLEEPKAEEVLTKKPQIEAAEKPPVKKETSIKPPEVKVQPVKKVVIDEMKDIKELLLKKYPKVALYDAPLNDSKAKRIKNAWKDLLEVPNTLLIFAQSSHKLFLENIAKAISSVFTPAKALNLSHFQDKENVERIFKSPKLQLIIAPDDVILRSKNFMSLYKELPQQKERYLADTPLILLPDLSLYFKDPKLKASLWKLLCHHLSQTKS